MAVANYTFWVQDRLHLVISVFCFVCLSENTNLKLITKTESSFGSSAYRTIE